MRKTIYFAGILLINLTLLPGCTKDCRKTPSSLFSNTIILQAELLISVKNAQRYHQNELDFTAYINEINKNLAAYNVNRSSYTVVNGWLPNSSHSNSPITGEFSNGVLMACHASLYTPSGNIHTSYYNFNSFTYLVYFGERPNTEIFLTEEFVEQNNLKDILTERRGENFEYYDPELTEYIKKEYLLVQDKLFEIDYENKLLKKLNAATCYEYDILTFHREFIENI